MPSSIAKGNITVRRYAVLDPLPPASMRERFTRGVRAHHFMPVDPRSESTESSGWVSVEDGESAELHQENLFFVASGGEQLRVALRTDIVKPPPDQVRRAMQQRVAELEASEGRALARRERQALKEEVVRQLKQRILPKVRVVDAVWLLDLRRIYFWSQSKGANETFMDLFMKSFGLRLEVEDANRWAHELLGAVSKKMIEPTKELWTGFKDVRPVSTVVVDTDEEGADE